MQLLRRPQQNFRPSVPHFRINIMTSTQFLRSMFTSLSRNSTNPRSRPLRQRVPTYPCPRPRDGCSQMTGRRGAQDEDLRNKVAQTDFEDWSNAGFRALLCAAACVYGRFCGCWMSVELLATVARSRTRVWKDCSRREELTSASRL
jgi:hypothetical protein